MAACQGDFLCKGHVGKKLLLGQKKERIYQRKRMTTVGILGDETQPELIVALPI